MKLYNSPDGIHQLSLYPCGEIRFGPEYFEIQLDKEKLNKRFFGDSLIWSHNSSYLALQEWLTISERDGPNTALVIFNLKKRRQCRISKVTAGWIVPLRFETTKIIYKKCLSNGITQEFETDLTAINRWDMIW